MIGMVTPLLLLMEHLFFLDMGIILLLLILRMVVTFGNMLIIQFIGVLLHLLVLMGIFIFVTLSFIIKIKAIFVVFTQMVL